uniref:PH domain-containing protein n=1 Tax=Schistosoma mansoni TaxID=6183 RepID=A0A5K4FCH9_SCHMA
MSSNYPQSNKDNETCQHDLLLDKQRFKTHNKHNKSNINDNHLKIVSNPITSSLGHNLQRIQLTTATTLSTSGCPMEYARINTTVDIVPSGIQQSKNRSLNAAMVAHLHQLEVRNQRLEKEKISLEHQLAHILKRLTTDQTINKNEHSNNENRGEEQQQNPSFSCINQSEQALVEEKGNIHRYSEKSSLKHAPIACFDDVSDKRSLLESLSGFSLGEYSSLSDAYDDICLNKNPLNDVNDSDLSELFYTEQKTLAHDDRCITNQLITEQSTHKENSVTNQNEVDNKQSFMKFEKEIKQSKEYLPLSPEELLIYRPDDKAHHDDNDNNSESYYNISTSSISPSPKPGIQRRTLSSRMRRVIPTRNERFSSSLSVESYDSSIDSMIINNHEMCDNEQLINLNYYNNMHNQSTSLPVSPVTPKNWISKNDFLKSMKDYTTKSKLSSKINTILDSSNISTLYSGGIRKSIHQQNSSNMRGSNISEVSNPTTFSSNTPQSQNKNSMISINKNNLNNGPPKIHISRKHLYEPKECLQFSDTSSSMSQTEKSENNLLQSSLSHIKNNKTTTLNNNNNQSINCTIISHLKKSIQNIQSTKHNISSNINQSTYNVLMNHLSFNQSMIESSTSSSLEDRLSYIKLNIGSINDFLNTNLETLFCIDFNDLLINQKNQLALKYFSKFIQSIDVFTCISGNSYLLQNIQLNLIHLMPIIIIKQTNDNNTIINYDQSSETNSELSFYQTISVNQFSAIDLNKTNDSLSIKSLKQFENLSNNLYNLKLNTIESSNQMNLLKQSNLFDNLSILNDINKSLICENYSGILLKLNNHLKIWHHYWCILTSKGLFLHQYQSTITLNQSTIINQPKKVILYTDIHNVRRPTNMSTSINQLICTSLPKNDSLLLLSSGSATTATMSTIRNNIETRPNVSAPVSRKFTYIESMPKIRVEKYFELVLHDKKVYRLRGVTSQETTKWLSLIKNMLRINEAEQILNKYKSQITKEGWLKRVRKGQIAWFWCRLAGFYLIYSLSPQSTVPVGCKNLKNSYIHVIGNQTSSLEREVTQRTNKLSSISTDFHNSAQLLTSSSDSDSLLISLNCSKLNQERQQTIKIWTPEHEPIYLLCPTVEECEQWRDSLIRATLHSPTIIDSSDIQKSPLSSSASSSLKLFENIREIWKQLVNSSHINNLYHSIVSIKEPISKTISTEYTEISLRLFNHLLFLCHPQIDLIENSNSRTMEIPLNSLINSSQWLTLKYLIVKQLIYFCTKYPILKDELYLQLIKQVIFSGIHTKQIPKDAYIILFKNKIIKRTFAVLACTKSQELTDESNIITSHLKYCNNFKQSEGSTFYLQIGNRYKQSLSEVTSQLTSSPIAKLNIPLTNLNNNRKPEHWWPSIAMWECLCLFLAFMLPSDPVVECLQQVFKLYMDPMRLISSTGSSNEIDPYEKGKSESVQLKIRYFTEIAGYAAFCRDTLNRTKLYGGRDQYPSVLEVFTISIRNPNTHVYPFSLPIYLPFGSNYEVVNFHGSSTIQDLQIQIIEKLGFHEISCKYAILFGIYLCLGESVIESKHIYLNPQWKICDIISMHEQFKLEYLFNNNQLKQEQEQSQQQIDSIRIDQISVKLLFKVQTFKWKILRNLILNRSNIFLLNFIVHQIHSSILSNHYQIPIYGIDFIDLIVYLCRADYYDYSELQKRHEHITFNELIKNYFPIHWLSSSSSSSSNNDNNHSIDSQSFIKLKLIILDRWTKLTKCSLNSKFHLNFNKINIDTTNKNENIINKQNHENQIDLATFYACFNYLKHLKHLFSYRFACSAYIARINNLTSINKNQFIWIVPQDEKINLLTCGIYKLTNLEIFNKINIIESKKIYCIKSILYKNIISYGGEKNGTFFLVYTEDINTLQPYTTTSKPCTNQDLLSKRYINQMKEPNYCPSSSSSSSPSSLSSSNFINNNNNQKNISQHQSYHYNKEWKLANTQQNVTIKKLKFFLIDLHALMDLTNVLTFLINIQNKN